MLPKSVMRFQKEKVSKSFFGKSTKKVFWDWKEGVGIVRPFHKTLPKSSTFINRILVIFYVTDCTPNKIMWVYNAKCEDIFFPQKYLKTFNDCYWWCGFKIIMSTYVIHICKLKVIFSSAGKGTEMSVKDALALFYVFPPIIIHM